MNPYTVIRIFGAVGLAIYVASLCVEDPKERLQDAEKMVERQRTRLRMAQTELDEAREALDATDR